MWDASSLGAPLIRGGASAPHAQCAPAKDSERAKHDMPTKKQGFYGIERRIVFSLVRAWRVGHEQ